MRLRFTGLFLAFVCACVCVRLCAGSAWLQDPPSRSALWMYGIRATPNYDFRTLDCGGDPVEIQPDGSRNCGICGDPISDPFPRPNENGGKYADPIIRTRYYEAGSVAEISVRNNLAGIPGFYEFRLCTNGENPTQECFNQNLLTITEVGKTNVDVPQKSGTNVFHVQLPAEVTCTHCMFQWRFRKEKSVAGCDNTNWCGLGRGPQIEFYNCADVIIGAVGQPKPTDPDVLQEPTYDGVDYGSAYDVATTLTTDNGAGNPGGTTTPVTTTSGFNIITVPITAPPGTTTASSIPGTGRLVFDSSGNQLPGGSVIRVGGSNSRVNNAQLLFLLGILPILGAATLRDNKPLPVPVAPVSSPRGFWVQTPPMSEYYLGANYGFGNFGSNGMVPVVGSVGSGGNYGRYGKSYGQSLGYDGYRNDGYNTNGQFVGNSGLDTIPRLANADFASTQVQLREMIQNNGNAINNGGSIQQNGLTSSWQNQGVGSSWSNQPASSSWSSQSASSNLGTWGSQNNQQLGSQHVSHIRPRSVGEYSKQRPQTSSYGNQNSFGQGTFQRQGPTMQPNLLWTNNANNNLMTNNNANNLIRNNYNNNFNGVTSGQRFPVQGTIPRPTVSLTPTQRSPGPRPTGTQPPVLPGLESASRFQQSTRTVTVQGPGASSQDRAANLQNNVSNGRQLSAYDWYYRLMGQSP